jgi:uncharacterized lipoprotein YddW (UPF0748 family)
MSSALEKNGTHKKMNKNNLFIYMRQKITKNVEKLAQYIKVGL